MELLVSITMVSMILAGFYNVYRVQTHTLKAQENHLETQQYVRAILDIMVREIRNAGYFPGTPCTSPVNIAGIASANAQSLQFVYDADGNNNCDGPDENVTYTYNSISKNITRAANGGAAQNISDGNATDLQFTYYPEQTSGIVPPPFCFSAGNPSGCSGALAANLANIHRILISLTIVEKNHDAEFGNQLIVTMNSNVNLRNH